MQEILDIFLEKSKHHHSNIIYAQIYKNDVLKEEFQAILDVQNIIAPAIAEKLTTDYDILFITGVGEVFPYIRSHNVLNNLQKFAKDKPLVFFFPGEYTMYEDTSSNLKLFSILPDDKYYRATNIYEIDEV